MPDEIRKPCCPLSPVEVNGEKFWCRPCPLAQNAPLNVCCPVPIEPLPENCFVAKVLSVKMDVSLATIFFEAWPSSDSPGFFEAWPSNLGEINSISVSLSDANVPGNLY